MVDLTNEHEMLEMAAKAAGHTIEFTVDAAGDTHCWYGDRFTSILWNPLVYHSDAFDLMVKLNIQVYRHPKLGGIIVCAENWSWDDYKHYHVKVKINKENVASSFCYAIVKVAAEIGRNIK